MSNIHFFLQGKGGIGKTTLSSFAAQYLKSIGKSVECFDTDTVNHSFMQWKELNVKECNICEMNGDVNHHAAEEMIEYLLEECKSENIIIDNGASSFLPMLSYLVENEIISILKGAEHNVFIHTIIVGGTETKDTAVGMDSVINNLKNTDAKIIIWLNYHAGEISANGILFSDWKVYKDNIRHIAGVIEVDFPTKSQLFAFDLDKILKEKITFNTAIENSKLISRNRLKIMRDHLFTSIESSGVDCFANTTNNQATEKKEASKHE